MRHWFYASLFAKSINDEERFRNEMRYTVTMRTAFSKRMTFDRRSKAKIFQFLQEIKPKQTIDIKAK